MNESDFAIIRLSRQQISSTKINSPKDIVAWMGAMQAQDYPMAKWAVGVRLPGSTEADIEAAIDKGEIIRTHMLRPTWHFVAAEDIYWMLDLTAPQVKVAMRARERDLELTPEVFKKSNAFIEKSLSNGVHLTREELITKLQKAGITTDQNRASHLFMRAELEKIICSGASRKGKPTFGLLSERVPLRRELSHDEALAELGRRYFTSRAPASVQDFTWWSGLSVGDARNALELIKPELNAETLDGHSFWLPKNMSVPEKDGEAVYLLPTYDEFIISYSDRSASIPAELTQHMKQISDRGVFRPIIVIHGKVWGIWKRTIGKEIVSIDLELFYPTDSSQMSQIEVAAERFGRFIGKKTQVLFKN